jgi:hypothetical protein
LFRHYEQLDSFGRRNAITLPRWPVIRMAPDLPEQRL